MLRAKKSWFFFDEEYVCLGTGINSRPNMPVATTINQVLMRSDVTIMQDGEVNKLPNGKHELTNVKWVHQDKTGYILPEPTRINLSNQVEQGRWSDITDQKNISKEIVSEDVFMLWFDHGDSPDNASYQYIVVPDVSEQALKETSNNNRNIEILSNTSDLQAVKSNKLDLYQLAFYKAGSIEISNGSTFSMDSQGIAMLKMQGNRVEKLTIADPSRKLNRILITVSGIYKTKGDHFFTIPNNAQNTTLIIVDLPQGVYAGKSVVVSF